MLTVATREEELAPVELNCPGSTDIPEWGIRVICPAGIQTEGTVWLRTRQSGDEMRLHGGTKSLKKLFIDRKIPADQRSRIAVIADDQGVLAVQEVGCNLARIAPDDPQIRFETL